MNHSEQSGDRPLGHHWRVSDELVTRLGLAPGDRNKSRWARRSIVAELALAAETDREWISYSRSRSWYAGGAHYPGCAYTYDTVVGAADDLIEAGLVEEVRGIVREGGSGIQSRMRASPLFIERLAGDLAVEHVGPKSFLIMRGEDGRMMPLPRTDRVGRMVRAIEAVNDEIKDFRVSVSPEASQEDWELGPRHWRARKVDPDTGLETWATVLPTPSQYLVQILGRGRLDCHGRLYAWYLGLPKVRRRELLLNDAPVEEPDFAFLHPDLLYTIAGAKRDGDPYVTGLHHRDHNKLALNVAINADGGRTGAIRAIAAHDKWRKWGLGYAYAAEVYDEVTKCNAPIARFLGSDAGVHLMGIDSRMCMKVLAGCQEAGIAALPVHDSFIVPATIKGSVEGIMEEVLHATRAEISPGSSNTSVKSILQAPSASLSASSLRPSKAKPVRPPLRPKAVPGNAVSCPSQAVEEAPAPSVALSSPTPLTPSWDREARERAMLAYQVRVAALFAREDGVRPGSSDWRERMDEARRVARLVSDGEWETGQRAFDVRCVPDRLPGEAKPRDVLRPRQARAKLMNPGMRGKGRRLQATPSHVIGA